MGSLNDWRGQSVLRPELFLFLLDFPTHYGPTPSIILLCFTTSCHIRPSTFQRHTITGLQSLENQSTVIFESWDKSSSFRFPKNAAAKWNSPMVAMRAGDMDRLIRRQWKWHLPNVYKIVFRWIISYLRGAIFTCLIFTASWRLEYNCGNVPPQQFNSCISFPGNRSFTDRLCHLYKLECFLIFSSLSHIILLYQR